MGEWLATPVIAPREVIALFVAGSFVLGVAFERIRLLLLVEMANRADVKQAAQLRIDSRIAYYAGERFPDARTTVPRWLARVPPLPKPEQ